MLCCAVLCCAYNGCAVLCYAVQASVALIEEGLCSAADEGRATPLLCACRRLDTHTHTHTLSHPSPHFPLYVPFRDTLTLSHPPPIHSLTHNHSPTHIHPPRPLLCFPLTLLPVAWLMPCCGSIRYTSNLPLDADT